MTQIERRDKGLAYVCDDEAFAQQAECRKTLQQLNFMDRSDFDGIKAVAKKLLGKSDNPFINPPFYCDYGFHIEVGKDFFANYNCTIIDVAKVTIGDNCFLAPNVAIYTAGHPVHPDTRRSMYEYGKPVTIGDNVWIGGNAVILPGVIIGSNSVIGAGSVVTHDIPPWSIATGNPCRVIRAITDADRKKLFKEEDIDAEAWEDIVAHGFGGEG